MKHFVRWLALVAFLVLPGCASWTPNNVETPVLEKGKDWDRLEDRDRATARTIVGLIRQSEATAELWAKKRSQLFAEMNNANHGLLIGGVTAVISGLRKSVEGATIGAALGGGSSLYKTHFLLDVQRANYRDGVKRMRCVAQLLRSFDESRWATLFDNNGEYIGPNDEDWKSVASIRTATVETMARVTERLEDLQEKVDFSVPDQVAIKASFMRYQEEKKKADDAVARQQEKRKSLADARPQQGVDEMSKFEKEKLFNLANEIRTCLPSE
jgi:hypothetical protein